MGSQGISLEEEGNDPVCAVIKAAAFGSLSLDKASVPKLLFGFRGSVQNPTSPPLDGLLGVCVAG